MTDDPLRVIVSAWTSALAKARERKKEDFGRYAAEAMSFFDGPYSHIYGQSADNPDPADPPFPGETINTRYHLSINKVAEFVQLYGPSMYQRNPDRKVTARQPYLPPASFLPPQDPAAIMQLQVAAQVAQYEAAQADLISGLLEAYLNYTPKENDLRAHCREWVDEALIVGASPMWTELYVTPSGYRVIGSFHDTINNLLLDPDATSMEEVRWAARVCTHQVWQVEREYGLPEGTLKGTAETTLQTITTDMDAGAQAQRRAGETSDCVTYYKIYSRMGLGGRLKNLLNEQTEGLGDIFGDNVFLVIVPGVPFPLNLYSAMNAEAVSPDPQEAMAPLAEAVRWPIEFWQDDAWPFTLLSFHKIPGKLWPMSHIRPAISELKFINWTYSFLLQKIEVVSRDFIVYASTLSKEVKDRIKNGCDYAALEISEEQLANIEKVLNFIQHPPFNPEIYTVVDRMMELLEKRLGLTDLVYGQTTTQLRSATEAQVKNQAVSVRPDDMGQQVEDACSELARKEMAAARALLRPEDVRPSLGAFGAVLWAQSVMTADPQAMFHQFDCSVEAGSARRPNRSADADAIQTGMSMLLTPFFQYAETFFDPQPFNALVGAWAKANRLDPAGFMLNPVPPVMPPEQEGGGEDKAEGGKEEPSGGQ